MEKKARGKHERTLAAADKASAAGLRSAAKSMHKAEKSVKSVVLRERKKFWFEKFHWFLSSEKYIVVSGASWPRRVRAGVQAAPAHGVFARRRALPPHTPCAPAAPPVLLREYVPSALSCPGHDAQQNDQLVKRYMRKGDVYVHADLHGAASCIVRNRDASGVAPIPLKTLEEAGAATVCHSNAWKVSHSNAHAARRLRLAPLERSYSFVCSSFLLFAPSILLFHSNAWKANIVTSAWWVTRSQVSKTAPSGEYLPTGSFMIRGKKNYLSPVRLECSFIYRYILRESCSQFDSLPLTSLTTPQVRLEMGFGVLFMTDEESAKVRKARFVARGGFDAESAEASADAAADAADAAAARAAAGPRLRKFERKRLRRLAEEGGNGSDDEIIVGATDATGAPGVTDAADAAGAAAPPLPAANKRKKALQTKERRRSKASPFVCAPLPAASGGAARGDAEEAVAAAEEEEAAAARAARAEAKKQKQQRAAAAKAQAAAAKGPKQEAPKRGHRGKQKKIAKKYRGQDAEERRERMVASGNPLVEDTPISASGAAAASGARERGAPRGAPKGPHAFAAQPHHKAGVAPEKPESLLDAGFEGIDALVEKASASLSEDLLHALVMCGPYSAFSQFTYRVKLQPGKERKGRACKAAVSAFVNSVKKEQTAKTGLVLAAAKEAAAGEELAVAGAAAAKDVEGAGEGEGAAVLSVGPSAGRVKAFFDRQMELVKGLQMAEMVSVMKGEVQLVAIRGGGKGGKKGGRGGKRGGGGRKKGKKGGGKKGKR